MGGVAFVCCCTACAALPLHHLENLVNWWFEPPKRCSINITSQAIKAGQGPVYVHNHCYVKSRAQHNKISPHQVVHLRCFKYGLSLTVCS